MIPSTLVSWALSACLAMAPASTSTPVQRPEARQHFDRGMAAWLKEDYATAQHELESAYQLEAAPALLYALGQLERLRGRCDRAIARFEAYLKSAPSPEAAQDTRVNILRCRDQLQADAVPAPVPLRPDPPQPPPPERRPKLDAAGVSLTAIGAVAMGVGVGLVGAAFAERRRAEDEFGVHAFERSVRRARIEYGAGLAVATTGVAMLVGGVVRLALVRRQHRRKRV